MHHPSLIEPYLEQAERLANGRVPPSTDYLPPITRHLPPLTQPLLDDLAARTAQIALTQPKRAWALTAVTEAAATHTQNPRLQASANWQMARAANAWYRPDLLATAVARARQQFIAAGATDESGWLAACDWQQYAEPWLHNDFQVAVGYPAT